MSNRLRTTAVFTLAVLATGCGQDGPLPDVVIVTIDTLRADHLGCYGYFRDTSPVLDALAAESLVFDQCLAPISQTLPTHTSLFTGLYPYEHGILANRTEDSIYVPSARIRTFAEELGALGYDTAAFVAAEPVKREGGLDAGFATWWEPEEKKVTADVVVDRAIEWLGQGRERPVLLWVHVFDVHALYEPPPPYDTMFTTDERQEAYFAEVDAKPGSDRYGTHEAHNLYDGEVRFADTELGRLFRHLESIGVWEGALAAVTSDHGEGLMQHYFNGHGHIWLEQMRVPFLLKAPGLAPGRDDVLCGTQDILPTAVARVPALSRRLSGWLRQVSGTDVLDAAHAPRPVYGQFPSNRKPLAHSMVEDGWRLIIGMGRDRLYHLETDPYELRDVAGENADRVADMKARLIAELNAQVARGEDLGAGEVRALGDERRKALESMGYAGDGDDEDPDGDGDGD